MEVAALASLQLPAWPGRCTAYRLFAPCIFCLLAPFAALVANNGGNRLTSLLCARAAAGAVGSVQAQSVARPVPNEV